VEAILYGSKLEAFGEHKPQPRCWRIIELPSGECVLMCSLQYGGRKLQSTVVIGFWLLTKSILLTGL